MAPALRSPVLRQLLVAMSGTGQQAAAAGSASEGLSSWLSNPRVLQLLREAARALRKGLLTEDQLVKLLQQEVKVRHLCHEQCGVFAQQGCACMVLVTACCCVTAVLPLVTWLGSTSGISWCCLLLQAHQQPVEEHPVAAPHQAQLPSNLLVEALNEHVSNPPLSLQNLHPRHTQ